MNEIYDMFLRTLTADIYDANLPIREHILKDKDIERTKNKDYTSNFLRLRHLKVNLSTNLQKIYKSNLLFKIVT